jgi:hypothetical protein
MVNKGLVMTFQSAYNSKFYSLVNTTEDLLEAVCMNTVTRQIWK